MTNFSHNFAGAGAITADSIDVTGTVTAAAFSGETVAHYADFNAARLRAKIVVTTGGTLRGDTHVKEG